ncbi:anti-sigma factor [uncultured Streptomyces sp.]|uniref:anti-sigma factor family protein n=1 Tax=uncultured Streptomyces sp. TaxID=174707 RepID=UPI00262E8E23|nr:zf-HC2 domain-containing protein [uncultured Streptomyces sp.]
MSGTGPTPAEQHLGDRLAALVDGELKHDARERVLAHLATCPKCKAEADAQRRLKNVFAQTAPPSPSEGFLARLQGLPGRPGGDEHGPFGSGGFADEYFTTPGGRAGSPLGVGYLPTAHPAAPVRVADRGFRMHDVVREAERSPWHGRRFAFAAAGAVSLAAIALGSTMPTGTSTEDQLRAEGTGSAVVPLNADDRAARTLSGAGRGGGALSVDGGPQSPLPSPTASVMTEVLAASPPLTGATAYAGAGQASPLAAAAVSVASLICPRTDGPLLAAVAPPRASEPATSLPSTHQALPRR